MSYSIDFRECVLRNISSGMSWKEAIETFKISSSSISSWINNKKETGSTADSPRKQYAHKKIDIQELIGIIKDSPDSTLEELSKHFLCSEVAVWKRLKTLGITRKKNHPIRRTK